MRNVNAMARRHRAPKCENATLPTSRVVQQERSITPRIRIGPVELEPEAGHIWKDGVRSYLPEQPLAILQAPLDASWRRGVARRAAPAGSGLPALSGNLTRLTHDSGLTTLPSVSENGEAFVYASDRAGEGQTASLIESLAR